MFLKSNRKDEEEEEDERAGSPQLEADLAFEVVLEVANCCAAFSLHKCLLAQDLSSLWIREPGVKTRSVTVDQLHIIDKNGVVSDLRYFHFLKVSCKSIAKVETTKQSTNLTFQYP